MQKVRVCSNADCPHNGDPQPIGNFCPDTRYSGGVRHQCKKCVSIYHAARAKTDAGRARAADRQKIYRRSPMYKRLSAIRYANRNKERTCARNYVNKQILRGKFPRASSQVCTVCGNPAQMYHHHNGYEAEHRMDVVPVCFVCHKAQHIT